MMGRPEPTHIPEGDYLTVSQVAVLRDVIRPTVHQWLKKGWLPSIQVPGVGHLINVRDLEGFEPPHPGPKPTT